MRTFSARLGLIAALATGCFANHSADEDAAVHEDDASVDDLDAAAPREDADLPPLRDGEVLSTDDAFIAPIRDAGVRPLGDAGPPGDRAGDAWSGYIEAFRTGPGSDHVRIVFDALPTPSGARSGVVVFGEGAPPPVATDPNVGYPPAGFGGSPSEGLEYRFDDAVVEVSRIRLSIDLGQLYETWCALQYPVERSPGSAEYACLPNAAYSAGDDGCSYLPDPGGEWIAVDCDRAALCGLMGGSVCSCTASECTAGSAGPASFDIHVTGDTATGTVDLRGPHNVYLSR
jgi:hypothetical protein